MLDYFNQINLFQAFASSYNDKGFTKQETRLSEECKHYSYQVDFEVWKCRAEHPWLYEVLQTVYEGKGGKEGNLNQRTQRQARLARNVV